LSYGVLCQNTPVALCCYIQFVEENSTVSVFTEAERCFLMINARLILSNIPNYNLMKKVLFSILFIGNYVASQAQEKDSTILKTQIYMK
jgi:hypothetical protein